MIDEAKLRALIREELAAALKQLGPSAAWLSQQEAAEHCGVSVATVRNWHKQGLKFQRQGKVTRYNRTELDAFLRRGTDKDPAAWAREVFSRKAG